MCTEYIQILLMNLFILIEQLDLILNIALICLLRTFRLLALLHLKLLSQWYESLTPVL